MQVLRRIADQQRVRCDHRLDRLQHIVLVLGLQRGDFIGTEQLQPCLIDHRLQYRGVALQHQDIVGVQLQLGRGT